MRAPTVLVAFAAQSGSTAGIAELIAAELRLAGLAVECRPAAEVVDLAPYDALVLGSGVFLRSRGSDGGGFLARHASSIAGMPVWLFCAGPIGRGQQLDAGVPVECPVMDVARIIGARGAAAFGAGSLPADEIGVPFDVRRAREWAREIAAALRGQPAIAAAG
jgi:menaquinone-dependent protoporphyrinogen oxidase